MTLEDGIFTGTLLAARLAFFAGECERCRQIVLGLIDRAASRPFHDRREIAHALAAAMYFGPMPAVDALVELDRVNAVGGDSLVMEASQATLRTGLFAMLGRAEDADTESDKALRLWDEISDDGPAPWTYEFFGEAHRFLERHDRAALEFRRGVERLTALGETGWNSTMSALHALALCDLGRFDEAEAEVQLSREIAAEDDFASQSAWRVAQARIVADRGDHVAALALVDEAIAINDATESINWQGEAYEVKGGILFAAGRPSDARAAFVEAIGRYESKGTVLWAERVRSRLEALG